MTRSSVLKSRCARRRVGEAFSQRRAHAQSRSKNLAFPLPVLAVDDLQVHVDSGHEHLAVDADLVDGGRREGVSHHHHPHDLIGHRAAVRQSHPDAQTPRDVDDLSGQKTDGHVVSLFVERQVFCAECDLQQHQQPLIMQVG